MNSKQLLLKLSALDTHIDVLCRQIAERRYHKWYVFILDSIRQHSGCDLVQRAALVAHDLQLVHKVKVEYYDLMLIRKLILATCPEHTDEFPPDYLFMLDCCLRFFAKQYGVIYRPTTLRFIHAPAIVFELYHVGRTRKCYEELADLILDNPTIKRVRHDASIVISGVPNKQFGPLEITMVYERIKPLMVIPDLNGHAKYYSLNPQTGTRGRRYHLDKQCKAVQAAHCITILTNNEFLLNNNITIPCKVCAKKGDNSNQ